jgi:two-component system cell cycle sensor histidine kinase/response regulator CckA
MIRQSPQDGPPSDEGIVGINAFQQHARSSPPKRHVSHLRTSLWNLSQKRGAMHGTVLIVDDDASVRDTARLALAREGYRILTASDGQTAIELMSTGDVASNVCTLLCDLEMPHMSGKQLIDHFRIQFPAIPVIVFSGASDDVYLDGIAQEGVCDWLRKPFTREALIEKVRTASNLFAMRKASR